MARYRGTGGAVIEIASPDPELIYSGALVLVVEEPEQSTPSPRKRAPKQAPPPTTAEEA